MAPGPSLLARLVISERITLAGLVVQPVLPPDEQLITEAALAAQDADRQLCRRSDRRAGD